MFFYPSGAKVERGNKVYKLSNYKVVKSNKLIESKSNFSSLEHRIILFALIQLKPTDSIDTIYKVDIRHILGRGHTSNYDLVRKAVKNLHESSIYLEYGHEWKRFSFVITSFGDKGTSYVNLRFHPDIKDFLLGLKSHYTSYTLNNVINFRKNYSLRIYELCKQYQRVGQRTLELDYLRILFSLESKYHKFYLFKKYVLNSAIEEINQHSDLYVEYKEIKLGRKVDSIQFIIGKNKLITDESQLKTLAEIDLEILTKEKLLSFGFNHEDITHLREQYTDKRISHVLELCESKIDDIKNPKIWILKTLLDSVNIDGYKILLESEGNKTLFLESKRKALETKRHEIKELQQKIALDKIDIEEYLLTGRLNPDDPLLHFKDKSASQAVLEIEDRIFDNENSIRKLERDIKNLERELESCGD